MSWNAVILGFIRNGQINEAQDMFSHMQAVGIHPNLMTFTTLICGLVQNGFGNEAILVFQKMQECGIRANLPIIISTISACTDVASLQYGRAIHGHILRHDLLSPIPVATALAEMYSKCGNMDQAKRVLV
jgi:pentatricopeptide repeat protein